MALPHLTTINVEGIEILQLIGSGGARDVYKAIIPSFAGGHAVAIKVVSNPRTFSAYVVANTYQYLSSNLIDTLSMAMFSPKLVVRLVPSIVSSRPIQLLPATPRHKPTL